MRRSTVLVTVRVILEFFFLRFRGIKFFCGGYFTEVGQKSSRLYINGECLSDLAVGHFEELDILLIFGVESSLGTWEVVRVEV